MSNLKSCTWSRVTLGVMALGGLLAAPLSASAAEPNPVYADANWKIYANSSARPRAWIEGATGLAGVEERSGRHITVKVTAAGRGTLVLSELYYPGWEARVNGNPQRIDEVHATRGDADAHRALAEGRRAALLQHELLDRTEAVAGNDPHGRRP